MTARRTAVVLIGSEIGLAALFGITGMMHGFHGVAYAQGDTAACYSADLAPMACPPTINLTDIHNVDMFGRCAEEDCSDQPDQVGVWTDRDSGNQYLELGEGQSFLIIDNTTEAPMA